MGSIWKVVLTFVVILLITITGTSVTSANVETAAAGDYLEQIAALIRESDYNQAVIQECVDEASGNGYRLEVEVYETPGRESETYARLRLSYRYRLAIFGVSEWKKKERII